MEREKRSNDWTLGSAGLGSPSLIPSLVDIQSDNMPNADVVSTMWRSRHSIASGSRLGDSCLCCLVIFQYSIDMVLGLFKSALCVAALQAVSIAAQPQPDLPMDLSLEDRLILGAAVIQKSYDQALADQASAKASVQGKGLERAAAAPSSSGIELTDDDERAIVDLLLLAKASDEDTGGNNLDQLMNGLWELSLNASKKSTADDASLPPNSTTTTPVVTTNAPTSTEPATKIVATTTIEPSPSPSLADETIEPSPSPSSAVEPTSAPSTTAVETTAAPTTTATEAPVADVKVAASNDETKSNGSSSDGSTAWAIVGVVGAVAGVAMVVAYVNHRRREDEHFVTPVPEFCNDLPVECATKDTKNDAEEDSFSLEGVVAHDAKPDNLPV
ncbi:hypothetical protein AC1031_017680 [Aphanomyces cochlioides]|nr:hypothetical protein AC1031_017680 [Aphanomyces cochlioides]